MGAATACRSPSRLAEKRARSLDLWLAETVIDAIVDSQLGAHPECMGACGERLGAGHTCGVITANGDQKRRGQSTGRQGVGARRVYGRRATALWAQEGVAVHELSPGREADEKQGIGVDWDHFADGGEDTVERTSGPSFGEVIARTRLMLRPARREVRRAAERHHREPVAGRPRQDRDDLGLRARSRDDIGRVRVVATEATELVAVALAVGVAGTLGALAGGKAVERGWELDAGRRQLDSLSGSRILEVADREAGGGLDVGRQGPAALCVGESRRIVALAPMREPAHASRAR